MQLKPCSENKHAPRSLPLLKIGKLWLAIIKSCYVILTAPPQCEAAVRIVDALSPSCGECETGDSHWHSGQSFPIDLHSERKNTAAEGVQRWSRMEAVSERTV